MTNGQTLEGWRTESVDFSTCDRLSNNKPKSVVVIDVDFYAEAGVVSHFGSDQDGLANISASAAAVAANTLTVGQGTSVADLEKSKAQKRDAVPASHASVDGDGASDPEAAFDSAMNPFSGNPMAAPSLLRPKASARRAPAPTFASTTVSTNASPACRAAHAHSTTKAAPAASASVASSPPAAAAKPNGTTCMF